MLNVYVLLTRSHTLLSQIIHVVTGDTYTHVSIAYDDELKTLCSFARRNPHFPLPAGLVSEDLFNGYFEMNRYIPCTLLMLPLSVEVHEKVRKAISEMLREQKLYHYDLNGLVRCLLGIESKRKRCYFCSMFVAEILQRSGAINGLEKPSLMKPQDFMGIKELSCVYHGRLSGLMHSTFGQIISERCNND